MAPDSNTLIGRPPGPSGSTMAGILLFGLIFKNAGSNCSPLRDVDHVHPVGQAHLFERDADLAAVGGVEGVQFDGHRMSSRSGEDAS